MKLVRDMERLVLTGEDGMAEQLRLEAEYKKAYEEALERSMERSADRGEFGQTTLGEGVIHAEFDRMYMVVKFVLDKADVKGAAAPKYSILCQKLKQLFPSDYEEHRLISLITLILSEMLIDNTMKTDNKPSTFNLTGAVLASINGLLMDELKYLIFENWLQANGENSIVVSLTEGLNKRQSDNNRKFYLFARMAHMSNLYMPEDLREDKVLLQAFLGEIIANYTSESYFYDKETVYDDNHKLVTRILPTEYLLKVLEVNRERFLDKSHRECMCVVPPADWNDVTSTGGYHGELSRFTRFIRQRWNMHNKQVENHTKRLQRSSRMDGIFHILNGIQSVPLRINYEVLQVVEAIYDNGKGRGETAGLPRLQPKERTNMPEGLTEDQIKDWKRQERMKHEENVRINSRSLKVGRTLKAARKYVKYAAIYTPWNVDYRGRAYGCSTDINVQGDDLCKALLEFAKPTPLQNEDDVYWFFVAGATHAAYKAPGQTRGLDKQSFDARVDWIKANHDNILESAENPLPTTGKAWWLQVSEDEHPLEFLAFCFEYHRMVAYKAANGSLIGWECRMAVPFDGSCSGLQHFSALLRDKKGGKAVNLTNVDEMQDVYMEVAMIVVEKLNKYAMEGNVEYRNSQVNRGTIEEDEVYSLLNEDKNCAALWLEFTNGKPNRKLVKRPTMTLVYGSNRSGFKDMILEDTIAPYCEGKAEHMFKQGDKDISYQAATFLAQVIYEALQGTVVMALKGMELLRKLAQLVTNGGHMVTWCTPNGLFVQQQQTVSQFEAIQIRIKGITVKRKEGSPMTRERLNVVRNTDKIDRVAQGNAVAPNFIHSLDAAHLQNVVKASLDEGITNFQLIHDSFATDLANSSRFFQIIREQFVALYDGETNLLEEFMEEMFMFINPKKKKKEQQLVRDLWDSINPNGSNRQNEDKLDLQEILSSKFAFS